MSWIFRRPFDVWRRQRKLKTALIVAPLIITPEPAECVSSNIDPYVELSTVTVTPEPAVAFTENIDPSYVVAISFFPAPGTVVTENGNPAVVLSSIDITPEPVVTIARRAGPSNFIANKSFEWVNGGPSLETNDIVWYRRVDFNKENQSFVQSEIFGYITGRAAEGQNFAEVVQGVNFLEQLGQQIQFARVGNLTDPDRQGYILISASGPGSPRLDIADGVDSIEKFGDPSTLLIRLGKLGLVHANFGDLTNVTGGLFKGNVYITGTLAGGSASGLLTGTGYWATPEGDLRFGNITTNRYISFNVSTGLMTIGSGVTLAWGQLTSLPTNLAALGDLPDYLGSTFIDLNTVASGRLLAYAGGTNVVGITAEGSGETSVRLFAGSTYANRASAPWRVQQDGKMFGTDVELTGEFVTLSGNAYTQMKSGFIIVGTSDDGGSSFEHSVKIEGTTSKIIFTWSDGSSYIQDAAWVSLNDDLSLTGAEYVNVVPALKINSVAVSVAAGQQADSGFKVLQVPA